MRHCSDWLIVAAQALLSWLNRLHFRSFSRRRRSLLRSRLAAFCLACPAHSALLLLLEYCSALSAPLCLTPRPQADSCYRYLEKPESYTNKQIYVDNINKACRQDRLGCFNSPWSPPFYFFGYCLALFDPAEIPASWPTRIANEVQQPLRWTRQAYPTVLGSFYMLSSTLRLLALYPTISPC